MSLTLGLLGLAALFKCTPKSCFRGSFGGLMSGGNAWQQVEVGTDDEAAKRSGAVAEGRVVRAGGRWYFVTRKYGRNFRWVFDTSALCAPTVGKAVLYGGYAQHLAVVFQKGCAVGWFSNTQAAAPADKS